MGGLGEAIETVDLQLHTKMSISLSLRACTLEGNFIQKHHLTTAIILLIVSYQYITCRYLTESYANRLPLYTYTRLITPALYTTTSCMVVTIDRCECMADLRYKFMYSLSECAMLQSSSRPSQATTSSHHAYAGRGANAWAG